MLLHKRFSLASPYRQSPLIIKSPRKTPTVMNTIKTPRIKNKYSNRSPKKASLCKGVKLPQILNYNSKVNEFSQQIYSGIKIQQINLNEDFEGTNIKIGYSIVLGMCIIYRQFLIQIITEKRLQLYKKIGQNQHIIQLLGTQIKKQDKYQKIVILMSQYAMAGSLQSLIKTFGAFPLVSLRRFIQDLLTGLMHIHSKKIAHLDLRSNKILIDSKNRLKIGGWFKKCQVFNSKIKGVLNLQQLTPYTPPQCILAQQFQTSYSQDIWSVGCLILQLCSGSFMTLTPGTTLQERKKQLLDPSFYLKYLSSYPPQLKTIVTKCLDNNPLNRPKVDKLLKMNFFTNSNQ